MQGYQSGENAKKKEKIIEIKHGWMTPASEGQLQGHPQHRNLVTRQKAKENESKKKKEKRRKSISSAKDIGATFSRRAEHN